MFLLVNVFFFPLSLSADDVTSDQATVPVTLEVTADDGGDGGGESPTPTPTASGCTDPFATNYDATVTADDGSCQYSVPNVSNFNATYQNEAVYLSWDLPVFAFFESVTIVKSATTIPTGPTDGEVIYLGGGTSVIDSAVTAGTHYYYAAFVRATFGAYSSGVLTSITIPALTATPSPSPGATPAPDPFHELPQVSPPPGSSLSTLTVGDFIFSQPGRARQYLNLAGGLVRLDGDKELTISVAYEALPEVLKTIGVTIFDPRDRSKSFSFLLRLNEEKTAYQATIGPLGLSGVYPIAIYIINYQDQTIKRLEGELMVAGTLFSNPEVVAYTRRAIVPVAVAGAAAGALNLLVTAAGVRSFIDLYLVFLRQFAALLHLFGLRRKQRPWGTVYDAVTKRPIDPAYVTIKRGETEVGTAITDIDGRYSFFVPRGEYTLTAGKTHYKFPSTLLAGKRSDPLYNNLYFGEPLPLGGGEVVNVNIPLDPEGFDWNEFVKSKSEYFRLYSRRELWRARIVSFLYRLGFASSVLALLFVPGWMNIAIFLFYVAVTLFQRYWREHHKLLALSWAANGEPLPFAVIHVWEASLQQEVKKVVADGFGRFFVLVRPGVYYLTVDEKQDDASYRLVYRSPILDLPKGVLNDDISVSLLSVPPSPSATSFPGALPTSSSPNVNAQAQEGGISSESGSLPKGIE